MIEKFLPIGSVVLLKGGKKKVMITGYGIFPANTQIKNGQEIKPKKKLYEYGGCIYPEGIIDSKLVCAFDHEQIEEICFIGYETDESKQINETLKQNYDKVKEEFMKNVN